MEIDNPILYRPKTIWFFTLFFLSAVAMETELPSPGDILHSYDVTGEQTDSDNITSQNVSSLDIPSNDTIDDGCFFMSNVSLDEGRCQAIFNLPPPSFEVMPPPPLPPFLKEIELLLNEPSGNIDLIFDLAHAQEGIGALFEEESCPLCQWSRGNNDTLSLFEKPKERELKEDSKSVMVWVLVGVALLSASIGAVLMGLFLRCRRKDVISICSKSSTNDNLNSPDSTAALSDRKKPKFSFFRSPFKAWGDRGAKTSLDPYRAESIQNTYSESPYINTDTSSTLYAEISTPTGVVHSTNSGGLLRSSDAYSEDPDPLVLSSGAHVNKISNVTKLGKSVEGMYSNSAYVVSEGSSEPNESSGGSTSTPSSAYYSDVSSSLKVHVNKRKKKKRKNDDKLFRLAPSQKLRNHYLPTFRPQQIHPLCPEGGCSTKFREDQQNIYCASTLVPGLIQTSSSNATFEPGLSFIQNVMGGPQLQLKHGDVALSLGNDATTQTQLKSMEGKDLRLFGNVCADQGLICRPQPHDHVTKTLYPERTQTKRTHTEQYHMHEKRMPAVHFRINDNIYHRHGQIGATCGRDAISEAANQDQSQFQGKIYSIEGNFFTDRGSAHENLRSDFNLSSEGGVYSEQDYLNEMVCSVQKPGDNIYLGREGFRDNTIPTHSRNCGNLCSAPERYGSSVYYDQGQSPCGIVVTAQRNDNIQPVQHLDENPSIGRSYLGNISSQESLTDGCEHQNTRVILRNGDNSEGGCCSSGQSSESVYFDQGQVKTIYRGLGLLSDSIYTQHPLHEEQGNQGFPCQRIFSNPQQGNKESRPCDSYIRHHSDIEQNQLAENVRLSICGRNRAASFAEQSNQLKAEDVERTVPKHSCRRVEEPQQDMAKDLQTQCFSPTPSEYI